MGPFHGRPRPATSRRAAALLLLVAALAAVPPARPVAAAAPPSAASAPVASITSPTAGATVAGVVPVWIEATAPAGASVSGVTVEVDGAPTGLVGSGLGGSTWEVALDARSLADGAHRIVAVVTDSFARTGRSGGVDVVVDNPAPTATITSPAPSTAPVGGPIPVVVTALPDPGTGTPIQWVELWAGDERVGYAYDVGSGSFQGTWPAQLRDQGLQVLQAIPVDVDGYRGPAASVQLNPSNDGPGVAVTSPATGAVVRPGDVAVAATASARPTSALTKVEWTVDGALVATATSAPWGATLPTSALPLGARTVRARVWDAGGYARRSAAVPITVAHAPSAPGTPAVVPQDRAVQLSWAPASSGGAPITGYLVERSSDGGATWTAAGTSASPSTTVDGLRNGSAQRFRVAAVDAAGPGPWSAASPVVVPIAVPAAPAAPVAAAGDGRATVTWSAPLDDGGSPITGYLLERSSDGGATWATAATTAPPTATLTGLPNGVAVLFRVAATTAVGTGARSGPSAAIVPDELLDGPQPFTVATTEQLELAGSDGTTWHPMPGLSIPLHLDRPGTAVVTGNADLWTRVAGVNQDLAVFVDGQLASWKESGGFAGTFSPNAALVEAVVPLSAGSHVVDLRWKANRHLPGSTISAGAGPIGGAHSPTRLTVLHVPDGGTSAVASTSTTGQLHLEASDGRTWHPIPGMALQVAPTGTATTAVITGNADLWTWHAGVNQDIAVFVDGQLAAWKESGGFAGTFSPNAAAVQAVVPLSPGPHLVELRWKANTPSPGTRITVGAGPIGGLFSPTRLTALLVPAATASSATSTVQRSLLGSSGTGWAPLDPALQLVVDPLSTAKRVAITANADLWTWTAGVNQDLGIFVDGQLVAWKESGGFAGTFSPNAATVATVVTLSPGVPHVIDLRWKANVPTGGRITSGAGPIDGAASPTRLTALVLRGT